MSYLKNLKVVNFKKLKNNEFTFDKGLNVIIGENDAGKSTLLQAIDICLNQRGNGDWKNRGEYGTLLNIESKNDFLSSKDKLYTDLPAINVEIEFEDLGNDLKNHMFNGTNNFKGKNEDGVSFEYSFYEQYKDEYEVLISENDDIDFIPFEFYSPKWKTFSGESYSFRRNPLKSILINTDKATGDSYKAFTKQVFSTLSRKDQNGISLDLKGKIGDFNNEIKSKYRLLHNLEIDPNRFVIEDNLDVFSQEDNVLLRDMGSGTENLIKTNLAMDVDSKLILLEEPENHLSFDLARKQIESIKKARKDGNQQLIVTTHSPLIVSKLSINNLRWLNIEGKLISFKDIPQETVEFFQRADNIDVLQVILAKRVVLVEGATEYMIMEDMIKQVTSKTANEQGIHVVSMGGNYYKRFKEVVNVTKNKVLIITDNDGDAARIEEANKSSNENLKIAMPKRVTEFTFEAALFNENKGYFGKQWSHDSNKDSWKEYNSLDSKLVYLLNNKSKSAFEYDKAIIEGRIIVPSYIQEGLKWLIK